MSIREIPGEPVEIERMTVTAPSTLRLFLDTADVEQWQAWLPTQLFFGATTNPTLLEKAKVNCTVKSLKELAARCFDLGTKELHLQTWGTHIPTIVEVGQQLAAIDPRVVVKVPMTKVGTSAAARLRHAGIRVTLTAVFKSHQALVAAALDAEYAAPYLGRITDAGGDGRSEIAAMQAALNGVKSPTRLLVASIRSPADLAFLSAKGLDTFTLSPAIATQLFDIDLTNAAALNFNRAARRMGASE